MTTDIPYTNLTGDACVLTVETRTGRILHDWNTRTGVDSSIHEDVSSRLPEYSAEAVAHLSAADFAALRAVVAAETATRKERTDDA